MSPPLHVAPRVLTSESPPSHVLVLVHVSGVGGGVVAQPYFQTHFGIIKNGVKDTNRANDISSNVVSVLQAGAFFGALGSAPLSGVSNIYVSACLCLWSVSPPPGSLIVGFCGLLRLRAIVCPSGRRVGEFESLVACAQRPYSLSILF